MHLQQMNMPKFFRIVGVSNKIFREDFLVEKNSFNVILRVTFPIIEGSSKKLRGKQMVFNFDFCQSFNKETNNRKIIMVHLETPTQAIKLRLWLLDQIKSI